MARLLKRLILAVTAVVTLSIPTYGQEDIRVPDEEDILHQTLSTASPYYYTNLMLKYTNGNEPLSDLE